LELDEIIHQLIVTNARLETHLEEVRDDKIRTEQRLLKEIGLIQLRLANAEAEKALWQGRYEGAAEAVEQLKKDIEFHKGQADIYRGWWEHVCYQSHQAGLRLLRIEIERDNALEEVNALKEGIDTIVTVFAENPDTGERLPVWLS
jgi:hypothetical protein